MLVPEIKIDYPQAAVYHKRQLLSIFTVEWSGYVENQYTVTDVAAFSISEAEVFVRGTLMARKVKSITDTGKEVWA